jgi:hypothetical protein
MDTATPNHLLEKRKKLEDALRLVNLEMVAERARKTFVCVACKGGTHAIQDCTAIQTHYYVEPSGCMGGDYWVLGDIHIVCPNSNVKIHPTFEGTYRHTIEKFKGQEVSFRRSFMGLYGDLFKEVLQDYGSDNRLRLMSAYFDANHKYFELEVLSDR